MQRIPSQRHWIAWLAAFVLLLPLLAACGGDPVQPGTGAETQPTEAAAADTGAVPASTGANEMTVVIRMIDAQDSWFRSELIPAAEQELGMRLNVVTFNNNADIEAMAKLEIDSGRSTIGLIKTPQDEVFPMVDLGYMLPLEDIVPADQLQQDLDDYLESAVEFGTINDVQYYIPRKLETNTMLYLQPRLDEAVQGWEQYRDDMNAAFEQVNGVGLPAGFEVEADPNQWDWYDLTAVAWYWANTPGDDGRTAPRVAHRGRDYEGTTVELFTKVIQMGGDAEDFLNMQSDPVVDTFEWEAFWVANGLYVPAMWEQSWAGGGIWNGFRDGQVYLAFMHQIDAFFIHGGTDPSMQGFLVEPDEMAVAIMPQGVSLELDDSGNPARVGIHGSNYAGWWWGIPKSSPNPEASYQLARFITSAEWHAREAQRFGMMPVRNDIYEDLGGTFEEPWMQNIFETALQQLEAGTQPPPQIGSYAQVSQTYRDAWFAIVTQRQYGPDADTVDRETIVQALEPHATRVTGLTE